MIETEKINQWKAPKWHSDFGDPELELNLLKSLCLKIVESGFKFSFALDCFEEGYISVGVFKNESHFIEIQVISPEDNKMGLFFENGDEIYIHDINEIENYL